VRGESGNHIAFEGERLVGVVQQQAPQVVPETVDEGIVFCVVAVAVIR